MSKLFLCTCCLFILSACSPAPPVFKTAGYHENENYIFEVERIGPWPQHFRSVRINGEEVFLRDTRDLVDPDDNQNCEKKTFWQMICNYNAEYQKKKILVVTNNNMVAGNLTENYDFYIDGQFVQRLITDV